MPHRGDHRELCHWPRMRHQEGGCREKLRDPSPCHRGHGCPPGEHCGGQARKNYSRERGCGCPQ